MIRNGSSFSTSDVVAGCFCEMPPAGPIFSALPEKMGEKRGAGLRLLPAASGFRQELDMIGLISHQHTLPESDYAPPVISESDLTAVTVS